MKSSQKKVKSEDEVESEERRCNSAKVRRKKIRFTRAEMLCFFNDSCVGRIEK